MMRSIVTMRVPSFLIVWMREIMYEKTPWGQKTLRRFAF